jgi:hypothetical protein
VAGVQDLRVQVQVLVTRDEDTFEMVELVPLPCEKLHTFTVMWSNAGTAVKSRTVERSGVEWGFRGKSTIYTSESLYGYSTVWL